MELWLTKIREKVAYMPNSIFDAEVTYIPSPLRLILFICRHLISRGYGGLRLYSYVKEGLGALRVGLYCEMDERGRNGERLAYAQRLIGSFHDFQGDDWPNEFDDYVSRRLSVALAAEEFEREHVKYLEACRAVPDQSYIEWYDGLLNICRDDGFPITEEPHLFGVDRITEIIFSDDSLEPVSYSRPPGFGNTIFPFRENELWERRAMAALREPDAPRFDGYAEWKRRVAEIERQTRK